MANEKGPQIAPANTLMGELQLQMLADVDPQRFPFGIDLILSEPGKIEPLGHVLLDKGTILAAVPPGAFADGLRAQMRAVMAQQQRQAGNGIAPPGAKA